MAECMKKIREHIYIGELALLIVLSAGWWGILYPGFSMTEETFEISRQDGDAIESECDREEGGRAEWGRAEGFFSMLEAAPDEIEIKSRFLEMIFGEK